jgi:hypothetical protein
VCRCVFVSSTAEPASNPRIQTAIQYYYPYDFVVLWLAALVCLRKLSFGGEVHAKIRQVGTLVGPLGQYDRSKCSQNQVLLDSVICVKKNVFEFLTKLVKNRYGFLFSNWLQFQYRQCYSKIKLSNSRNWCLNSFGILRIREFGHFSQKSKGYDFFSFTYMQKKK